MKKIKVFVLLMVVLSACAIGTIGGCSDSDEDVASENLSKAAEQFEIERRITLINGITDKYLLTIQGLCGIEDEGVQLEITCKVGEGEFKKDFVRMSDNVTYLVEQLKAERVSTSQYRVIFKPEALVPDFDRP